MAKYNIYYHNDKGTKVLLKYYDNKWNIDKYYESNIFYLMEDKNNYSRIVKIAECSKEGHLIRITNNLRKYRLEFDTNSFKIKDDFKIKNNKLVSQHKLVDATNILKSHVFDITNSHVLINSHSNFNFTAGDTIMISNYMNILMKNNNYITLISTYKFDETIMTRNLQYDKYKIIQPRNIRYSNNDLINQIDINHKHNNIIFIRNHEILPQLNTKSYLNKIIFYGLDIHVPEISKMNNRFLYIITQSDKLKQLYINKGVLKTKIGIVEPVAYKYNFKLPVRNDNQIRLIYCGTLRDEENILEIIEEFKKIHLERPEVVLSIIYCKIHGDKDFKDKVNAHIKNGVKGITFKHNLSHKDACYEIATSDIGICWRKNGYGDNGEVSTKVKEYELYGLEISNKKINIQKKNVSIICCTNRPSFHWNILQNVNNLSKDNYNIKLLICLNSKFLGIKYYKKFFDDNNIENEIIKSDKSLGECLNNLILKSDTRFIIKIDDDDIYLPGLINNCIPHLHDNPVISLSKKYVYCPENNKLFIRETNLGYGSLLGFDKYKIKNFKSIIGGEDTHFLKNNKVKLLNLLKYHVHIRHLNVQFHTDKDKNYFNKMSKISINNYIINTLKDYGLYDIKTITEKNDITIKKFLDGYSKPNLNLNNYKKKLNVIGILDEFLYNTYKNIFNIQLLNLNQVIDKKYDFFFCESCWNGNNGKWKWKIYSNECNPIKKEVDNIIKQCNKLKIPTIFYNKEDPVNFDNFIETAKHFDIIITTDINCVEKYKKLTKSKIFVMPFTIDPFTINNIGRKNDNNESFFAGSYVYSLSNVRKRNTDILLDKLKTKDFILFDRSLNEKQRKEFYNNQYSLNMFKSKYNKYIHTAITHDTLINIHLKKNWCGNLNTVKDSGTMFARRILEASIMKNSVVSDYSLGVYKNFKYSIYKLEDELKYNTNEDILLNQIKKQIGWRTVIEHYNSYNHFSKLLKEINIENFYNPFSKKYKISVICSTNRINNYSIILENFNRQKYVNKELIIVFNLDMNNEIQNIINSNKNSNIKINQFDEKETLGYCLNKAIELSNGDIISKFDDDDYYGETYLLDMNYSMIISNADLVGKCAHMVYALETKELWIKFYKINYENYTYQVNKWNYICGATLFFKKNVYEKCKFKESNTGEDTDFIEQVKNNKFTIYVNDFFNYCYIRDKQENHTYKVDLNTFLGGESIMINKYDKIPINLIDC